MSALMNLLDQYRAISKTEREKGTYFEELIRTYLRHEPTYRDLYSDVWLYSDWAKVAGVDGRDVGIDLVAKTQGTNELHAIQCKFYATDYRVQKGDIDSFFTASGKTEFSRRLIITTTDNWTENANDALQGQNPPCFKIDLAALESSVIDWAKYAPNAAIALRPKKQLRDHQVKASKAVIDGLATADRGKLIMACGTGKTFTSLKIAERMAGKGKRVLFLVPSLSLLSQTLTEWTQESDIPLHSFAVCSDSEVGKKRKKDDDIVQTFAHELQHPATTDPKRLAQAMTIRHDSEHMSVVFSTYHSIEVIHQAQKQFGMAGFDFIVCDEAHRTTGATFEGAEESAFVRIHDADYIQGAKRLYMTATPRIYGEQAQAKASDGSVTLCSMDDTTLFGNELHIITFHEAVQAKLLVDYKVIVLAMDESHVDARIQKLLSADDNMVKVEDAAKIIGCWKALSKQGTQDDLIGDTEPMKRAVAFAQIIEHQTGEKKHKISSKHIASIFSEVVEAYKATATIDEPAANLYCEADHVDGGMTASEKEAKLNWLKSPVDDNTCRILSNVRCLSEGVDVPSLDAVLFLTPRNSQVDVVQSVGRVMRLAPNKKRGYVILPVVIPANVDPAAALDSNETYKVVWQVLQALRSHDDRFDAMINATELEGADKSRLEVIAVTNKRMEVTAVTDNLTPRAKRKGKGKGRTTGGGIGTGGGGNKGGDKDKQLTIGYETGYIERAIYAKVVQKCGNRTHWEDWAVDIAKIAKTHITRIQNILSNPANTHERTMFDAFALELRDDLNGSISDDDIIEMLAQHLITKPVFDALFNDYSFASKNPMSLAMQTVIDALQEHNIDKEADTLAKFYDSVKVRAAGVTSAEGKQKIIVELYDKFFAKAFPRMQQALGIVYTPVEVVDFIIHSVNDVLEQEFGQSLGSDGVHIIDPFTGTGTFITRLLQSGLLTNEQIKRKFPTEIHANEIVLLAYYIAAINIEAVYHGLVGGDYVPFNGICLTDTFQMYEQEDMVDVLLEQNSARRKRQKKLDIRVIIGNPPYSAGQDSANDNNANVSYPDLDQKIALTYAARSTATNKNTLYDSYIRAIRWATNRVGDSGIIGFVTNGGFLESGSADGLRKCLADEFSSVYVFHLRGNQRTQGEQSRREGGKIFGGGSRAPIAISILVKNPESTHNGRILFHDIGDYLNREDKLEIIENFGSIQGITDAEAWTAITPDEHGDWLRQRDNSFTQFVALGDKSKDSRAVVLFENYSRGLESGRDAWVYNHSKIELLANIERTVNFYNSEVNRFSASFSGLEKKVRDGMVSSFVSTDSTKISWTRDLRADCSNSKLITFRNDAVITSLYRPFTKQFAYFDRAMNSYVNQMPRIFPDDNADNLIINITGVSGKSFSCLIANVMADVQNFQNGQCFPLYLYDEEAKPAEAQGDIFNQPVNAQRNRRDAITDEGLKHFTDAYPDQAISKEDIFYYVYGLLHSPDYREQYADNLSKELPRIPRMKTAEGFWSFSTAGRALAHLHLNYETVDQYTGVTVTEKGVTTSAAYRVTKMKFGTGKDKSTIIYNGHITVTGIPLDAYDYVVNGKPAIEWVMDRQVVKTDKASGIVNDANDWAIDTMNNPKYPLELLLRVITVSLETNKLVKSLPALEIFEEAP
jgi:predicted helicase